MCSQKEKLADLDRKIKEAEQELQDTHPANQKKEEEEEGDGFQDALDGFMNTLANEKQQDKLKRRQLNVSLFSSSRNLTIHLEDRSLEQ